MDIKTGWDYTELAHTYDQRADYSPDAVIDLFKEIGIGKECVGDIGAGTGKLTRMLCENNYRVKAVEPNENMRMYGQRNTEGLNVDWMEGTAENTGLETNSLAAIFFGSSFNVINHELAFQEIERVLKPDGWFACMWNHRDLEDPLQKKIEAIIRRFISDFDYGQRRLDPTSLLEKTGYFKTVRKIERSFEVRMKKSELISAWRSHGTLFRQSSNNFNEIIEAITDVIPNSEQTVPYSTKIWFAQSAPPLN